VKKVNLETHEKIIGSLVNVKKLEKDLSCGNFEKKLFFSFGLFYPAPVTG
jgi:hypothetical protein